MRQPAVTPDVPLKGGVLLVLAATLVLVAPAQVVAQDAPPAEISLSEILLEDGTLDLTRGVSGSVDVSGYQMELGSDGAPVFLPAGSEPGDEFWAEGFHIPGVAGNVFASALGGDGSVFIGGEFGMVDGVVARNVARWDGSQWHSLGLGGANGVDHQVFALAVSGTDIFVGGIFTTAGGQSANRVARWDGEQWHSLGTGYANGVGGPAFGISVHALAVSGTDLFVGGHFTTAGGQTANRVARWDGSSWHRLGTSAENGVNNRVRALAVSGTDLFLGGDFTQAGGQPASRIARWDGSQWHSLGTGANLGVYSLAVSGTDLYVGGRFSAPGIRIARWDGSQWHGLGLGFGVADRVLALAASGTDLYVGGEFVTVGGQVANNVARWDGSQWHTLGTGVAGVTFPAVYALAVAGTDLIVGGTFGTAGGQQARRIARWDGILWHRVGTGAANGVYGETAGVQALVASGTDLFAGGYFTQAGDQLANRVARWDGSQWHSLGAGVDSPNDGSDSTPRVNALAVSGTDLFVGGVFRLAGGQPANRVARWDGSQWHNLGTGVTGPSSVAVHALAVSGKDLYVGGRFTEAGGQPASGVARWDGGQWHGLGTGVSGPTSYVYVSALAVSGTDLYVGGRFTQAGDIAANQVARWDGSQWYSLGAVAQNGVNDEVHALAVSGTDVVVGGDFTQAGGEAANYVARWDGSHWHSLGTDGAKGVSSRVEALTVSGTDLLVGGWFTMAGGEAANRVARWDGSHWSSLGSGLNYFVRALASNHERALWVGGGFSFAGGKPSITIARWDGDVTVSTEGEGSLPAAFAFESIYPNPLVGRATIRVVVPRAEEVTVTVYDLLGRAVGRMGDTELAPGIHELPWDAGSLAAGVYLLRMTAGAFSQTRQVVVVR